MYKLNRCFCIDNRHMESLLVLSELTTKVYDDSSHRNALPWPHDIALNRCY